MTYWGIVGDRRLTIDGYVEDRRDLDALQALASEKFLYFKTHVTWRVAIQPKTSSAVD